LDIQKQIDYWRQSSDKDFEVAGSIMEKGHFLHALFFAELALEKMLKAHVVVATGEVPLKSHDLLRPAGLARLTLNEERRLFLARFQQYCMEGRYPEDLQAMPSREEAETAFGECGEALEWLKSLFK
jgi:HEPN domain-containing protein